MEMKTNLLNFTILYVHYGTIIKNSKPTTHRSDVPATFLQPRLPCDCWSKTLFSEVFSGYRLESLTSVYLLYSILHNQVYRNLV